MQLVGQLCVHCRERVTRENEARFCPKCGRAVHSACAERARAGRASGCCRACGAPALPAPGSRRQELRAARGYGTVAFGVALMIGGILGSMCFFAAGGTTQLVAAGGAIAGGVVLVAVGFLQSARR